MHKLAHAIKYVIRTLSITGTRKTEIRIFSSGLDPYIKGSVLPKNFHLVSTNRFMSSGVVLAESYPESYIENDFVQNPPVPKLPVPPLDQTLQRYLASIEAVVSAEQMVGATKATNELRRPGGIGEKLQKKIEERAENLENWAYDWWLDDMYLKNRLALPVNSNPGMVFPRQEFKSADDQLKFAAKMILGIVTFKRKLDTDSIPVDMAPGKQKFPLCMAQHKRLLTCYRRPRIPKDQSVAVEKERPSTDYHVIIAYKNQFYALQVIRNTTVISAKVLVQRLRDVLNMVDKNALQPPVGLLTSDHRDNWAKAYALLSNQIINRQSLNLIESALCVICFEDPLSASFFSGNSAPSEKKARDDGISAHQMLHGGGSKFNSGNRWFDKTLQIIISTDGTCGLCYEHSAAEGIVVIQLLENLLQSPNPSLTDEDEAKDFPLPEKLQWKLDSPELQAALKLAAQNIDKLAKDTDFYVLRFEEYGREFPKKVKCSPDAFIQMALQLTYYKMYRKLVSTYESAGTRRFRFGRVDNIRSATSDALQWAKAMTGETKANKEEKEKLFRTAMTTQVEIMTYNISGQGIDCHLLGLREMSKELGLPLPSLFGDECYAIWNHFALSTSQVPTQTDSFMGYGAVVPNGYGASYNPHADSIVFCISSFLNDPDTDSQTFAQHLVNSLLEMKTLLQPGND